MFVDPIATELARPVPSMVATVVSLEFQEAELVMFWVGPAVNVPVAMYCWVDPTGTLALKGAIEMDTRAAGLTVKEAALEVTPPNCAVMVEDPTATVVARPFALMVATAVLLEFHDTVELMS